MSKEKQIEEKSCEKCLHYCACLRNSEYYPEKPCFAYEDKAGYRKQSEGEWIEKDDGFGGVYYDCTACGCSWTTIDGTPTENNMNYCPECGAKMKGGAE